MAHALDVDTARNIGIGVIVAVVVIGLLLSLVITALVGRLILLAVVVALGVWVWTERASISDHVKKCDATFFGVHLTPTDPQLKQLCQKTTNH